MEIGWVRLRGKLFKEPRVNVIESDEGFSVEVLGRTGLLYIDKLKSVHIDSEVLTSRGIAIIKDSIRTWNPPYEKEIIDDTIRDTIIDNIKRAFDYKNVQIYVD